MQNILSITKLKYLFNSLKVILLSINLITILTLSKQGSLPSSLSPFGLVHPFLVIILIPMLVYLLSNKAFNWKKKNTFTLPLISLLLELSLISGIILYFVAFNKVIPSKHYWLAIISYPILNFTLHIKTTEKIDRGLSTISLIMILITAHMGAMKHMGQGWWIW